MDHAAGTTRWGSVALRLAALAGAVALVGACGPATDPASPQPTSTAAAPATVWLCRPGLAHNPCEMNRATTRIDATGRKTVVPAATNTPPPFDCFYVYPTVSRERGLNADLTVEKAEVQVAERQASRFSQTCRVWAPMYRQSTVAAADVHSPTLFPPASADIAYQSLKAGFEDYLAHENNGRPIVFLGHSQGAALLVKLLADVVDNNPAMRDRLALAMILGGNAETARGAATGGSFHNIPTCSHSGQAGCVIAYSGFPGQPPVGSLFGRPAKGVSLQAGMPAKPDDQVDCVNPAAMGGGSATLDPYFLATSQNNVTTPWVEYPGRYTAECRSGDNATWLQVTKATGGTDPRPVITETFGPKWGYHVYDVNVALGNLLAEVTAAESAWSAAHH